MKNNRGITLTSLVLYVLSFLMICGMIAVITTFFYNNEKVMSDEATDSVEWDIFNTYMAKECNIKDNTLKIIVGIQTVDFVFEKTGDIISYDYTNYKGFVMKKYNNDTIEKDFAITKPTIKGRQAITIKVYDDKNPEGKYLAAHDEVEVKGKFEVAVNLNNTIYSQVYYLTK